MAYKPTVDYSKMGPLPTKQVESIERFWLNYGDSMLSSGLAAKTALEHIFQLLAEVKRLQAADTTDKSGG
jgi:hypothetical protein